MLKVSVDESHAFDMLSILDIKIRHSSYKEASFLINQRKELWDEIVDQLGYLLSVSIFASQEYDDLVSANKKIFELVDKAKKDNTMPALIIDEANYKRFLAKKSLQYWFFGIESMTEKKIGYEGMETNRE